MAVTTNIQLSVPSHGANVDTWDTDPINDNSNVLDALFGGTFSLSATSTTLSIANARNSVLKFSGVINATTTITLPAIIKSWTLINQCTGTGTLILSTGTGNVIGVPRGTPQDVVSDGTNLYFKNLGVVAKEEPWDVASMPSWVTACTVPPYLLCDGSTYSSSIYPALFLETGTTALPDARGRSRFNLNGGTSRITTAESSIDGNTKLSAGGVQSVTLAENQLPTITPAGTIPNHNHTTATPSTRTQLAVTTDGVPSNNFWSGTGAELTGTTSLTFTGTPFGSGQPHTNMPPAYVGGITVIRAA